MKPRMLILLALLAGLLLTQAPKIMSLVRGIRNNNPGNIRLSATTWAGQVPPELQKDDSFVQFQSPEYGIRAMAKILQSYAARGINTVSEIAQTWAPPNENDTVAYINSLVAQTGFGPNELLSAMQWPAVIAGIIRHENGIQPYDADTIRRGVAMT